jgi:hypothetical protein
VVGAPTPTFLFAPELRPGVRVTPDPRVLRLAEFRAEYGRLCQLSAQALHNGFDRDQVHEAARGMGAYMGPTLPRLRRQRGAVDRALASALAAGVEKPAIISAALEVKRAAEGEWHVRIPIVGSY